MEVIENNEMKTGTKVFLGVLASAILVGGLGALTRGFTNWDPDTWLDQWQTEDPEDSDEEDTKVEGEKVEMLMKGGPKFASRSAINDTKTVTATIKNADAAMDKRIKWESSDSTKISVGKTTTNSGESNTVKLAKYFSGTVTIYAYPSLLGKESGASIEVTYDNAVQSLEGGVIIFDDETSGQGSSSVDKNHAAWVNYFETDQSEPREAEGLTAMKSSGAVTAKTDSENFVYYSSEEGSCGFALGGGSIMDMTGGRQIWVMLHGVGQEGCDNLPGDDDGTLYSVASSQEAAPEHRIEAIFDGNECWVYVCFDLGTSVTTNTGFENEAFRYELGDASFQITTKAFVHASGVDVSENAIVF